MVLNFNFLLKILYVRQRKYFFATVLIYKKLKIIVRIKTQLLLQEFLVNLQLLYIQIMKSVKNKNEDKNNKLYKKLFYSIIFAS